MKRYYVYILSNKQRTVFYTGITNDIERRLNEHQDGIGSRFTQWYRVTTLLHFEEFSEVRQATAREKEIKGWIRAKKLALIKTHNPELKDLAADLYWPSLPNVSS